MKNIQSQWLERGMWGFLSPHCSASIIKYMQWILFLKK